MTKPLLAEKVAVVTGAGQGIGREIARALHHHGAEVVLADLDGEAAHRAALDIGGCVGTACDVTSEAQVQGLTASTAGEYGRLDIFVNNAGITRDASLKASPTNTASPSCGSSPA
jgi:3-oxoacyl-[acyl-carrier protein] reductase